MNIKIKYYWIAFFAIVAIFVCLSVFNVSSDTNAVNAHAKPMVAHGGAIKAATAMSKLDESAFVFLALGAQANQMNCPAAIESLVRYGGWSGEVQMITDREICFDEATIVKNSGMDPAM